MRVLLKDELNSVSGGNANSNYEGAALRPLRNQQSEGHWLVE